MPAECCCRVSLAEVEQSCGLSLLMMAHCGQEWAPESDNMHCTNWQGTQPYRGAIYCALALCVKRIAWHKTASGKPNQANVFTLDFMKIMRQVQKSPHNAGLVEKRAVIRDVGTAGTD